MFNKSNLISAKIKNKPEYFKQYSGILEINMRIYLKLSNSKRLLPFTYQSYLTGALHKWIGDENELHEGVSLYSFSWLQNVNANRSGINLTNDSYFFISVYDDGLIKRIIKGIISDPSLCFGIVVTDVQIAEDREFSSQEKFFVASPVFIKRRFDNNEKHITYSDPNAALYLTETLQKKLRIAGLPEDGIRVSFDKDYPYPRTKIISYKTIGNKVNICPVIIEGSQEQIAFAWNVGVGNSTGIGFGALK